MMAIAEALGLTLPGASFIPADPATAHVRGAPGAASSTWFKRLTPIGS